MKSIIEMSLWCLLILGKYKQNKIIIKFIGKIMGINNRKFFDAKSTSSYFSDIETEFNSFKTSASVHQQSQYTMAATTAWDGVDADAAKTMIGVNEATLLQDIFDQQTSMVQLQNDILEKFRWDVDYVDEMERGYPRCLRSSTNL